MVGYPVLRVIIGADLVRAVARAHQGAAATGNFALVGRPLGFGHFLVEALQSDFAVANLRAAILALGHGTRGQVGEAHRRLGLVYVLPARAAGPEGIYFEVGLFDVHILHFALGHHHYGGGAGVHPALALGLGYPLYTMRAALEFQLAVYVRARHLAGDLAIAPGCARVLLLDLHPPALALEVFRVHPKQVAREDGRLVAARPAANFHQNIALVFRIFGNEEQLDRLLHFIAARL